MRLFIFSSILLAGCAGTGNISQTIHCNPCNIDQSGGGSSASSIGSITSTGNTPTATTTTTLPVTIPVGPGAGITSLPGLPSLPHVSGAMIVAPSPSSVVRSKPKISPRHISKPAADNSQGWKLSQEWWNEHKTFIRVLDKPEDRFLLWLN